MGEDTHISDHQAEQKRSEKKNLPLFINFLVQQVTEITVYGKDIITKGDTVNSKIFA